MVRARGVLDAAAFDAALARAANLTVQTVVIDLLEVEAFPMEAASALLRQRRIDIAMATTSRVLLRPSPAVARKLEQLGLTAVLLNKPGTDQDSAADAPDALAELVIDTSLREAGPRGCEG
jgi:anti-anti-sigma regulatory factor